MSNNPNLQKDNIPNPNQQQLLSQQTPNPRATPQQIQQPPPQQNQPHAAPLQQTPVQNNQHIQYSNPFEQNQQQAQTPYDVSNEDIRAMARNSALGNRLFNSNAGFLVVIAIISLVIYLITLAL